MLRASLAPPNDRAHIISGLAEVLSGMDYAAVLDGGWAEFKPVS
jgi:hypothetical protein